LIGPDFVRSKQEFDTRMPGKYLVVKCQDVLTIYNMEFTAKFFERQDTQGVQRFIDYFKTPELIFAHEHYDSGGTYSYALIYNGVLKRQFRSSQYYGEINFGELEGVEKEWQKNMDSTGDFGEVLYDNIRTGEQSEEIGLPFLVLTQLLFDKLGFDDWYEDRSRVLDEAFYVKKETADIPPPLSKQVVNSEGKKESPWWKFWWA